MVTLSVSTNLKKNYFKAMYRCDKVPRKSIWVYLIHNNAWWRCQPGHADGARIVGVKNSLLLERKNKQELGQDLPHKSDYTNGL